MSYTTYTTDALVCGTYDRNTADRSYRLFTRELGMVWADARSVRLEKSRQRMALADFSLVRVSLVRGKGGWKIGSVIALRNFYHDATDQAARGSVALIVRTLRRFVAGEEVNMNLFDQCVHALGFFVAVQSDRQCYERIFVQRLLAQLGYIKTADIPDIFQDIPLSDLDVAAVCQHDKHIAISIERAQSASHL